MNRSTFWMIKYMNGSVFSKARYMNGVGFEILARTPVPKLSLSYPPPHPPPSIIHANSLQQSHLGMHKTEGCREVAVVKGLNIGIKHGFSCINIRQVPRERLKTEAGGRGFQHLPRDLANANALKTMFDPYYCVKTENNCYISHYFLHFFVPPFHRCRANAISTYYAYSRAGQYIYRDGSNSVAPVRAY